MKWEEVLRFLKNQPVIETLMLGNKPEELARMRVQLSRWVKSGRLVKVRNGLYIFADAYRPEFPDREYIATFAIRPSYISLEYALSGYGLIPEYVPAVTLVTTKRPGKIMFSGNRFVYRHVQPRLFWGYIPKGGKNFEIFYAEPEKAVLDLFYFTKGELTLDYMEEMRFQNTEILNMDKMIGYAAKFGQPRISKAAELFSHFAGRERGMKEL
ncbi:MAG: hypothetical protein FJ088_07920 [Deltaproteobacteria bacterium]|nr:hypothetical protein [Deltaproteobacteria bacterium]